MQRKRLLNQYMVLVAGATLFIPTAMAAQAITGVCSDAPNGTLPSCTCKSPSGYTIQLTTETPAPTQTMYTYTVSGSGNAKVSSIREVQVIVPRPVSTTNQDPTAGKGIIVGGTVTAINT